MRYVTMYTVRKTYMNDVNVTDGQTDGQHTVASVA